MADTEKKQKLLADGWIETIIMLKDGECYVTYEEKGALAFHN
ncbi:hypothetical protein [Psychrobacillus soli]|nr:hypothetical protein [Psychrobacillus soli]